MADLSTQAESRIANPPLIQSGFSRRVSWGALFAGVVVASVVQMLLTVLGTGIGAATIDAAGRATAGIGIGAGLWLALSSVIAFYCGGWTAGRLAAIPRTVESTLHGFLTWGLAMVIGMVMVSSAIGGLLGGVMNIAGQAAGSGGAALASSAGANGGNGLSQTVSTIAGQVKSATGGGAAAPSGQDVQQATQRAANNVTGASLAGFLVMLLGAGAASLGGRVSTPENTILASLPAWERRTSR